MKFSFLVFVLSLSLKIFAQPLFNNTSILELKLKYDIQKLQIDKDELRENGLDGELTTLDDQKLFSIKVLTRGKGSFECQQPQLKIDFNKKDVLGTIFENINKIKLFTKGTCLENKTDTEQDKQIIANYLIYKLYEEFSDFHFKTRLLKIIHEDTSQKFPPYEQYGFFLEPNKNLEQRLGVVNLDVLQLMDLNVRLPELTSTEIVSKINAFEFLIANYDYGIPGHFSHIINDSLSNQVYYGEKNSKIYRDKNGLLIPFIYDFDFSRFGYMGPHCSFAFPFFWGTEPDLKCDTNNLKNTLLTDLEKFKYKNDVLLHLPLFSKSLESWRKKNQNLIHLLGDEYSLGLNSFQEALKSIQDSNRSFIKQDLKPAIIDNNPTPTPKTINQ